MTIAVIDAAVVLAKVGGDHFVYDEEGAFSVGSVVVLDLVPLAVLYVDRAAIFPPCDLVGLGHRGHVTDHVALFALTGVLHFVADDLRGSCKKSYK